MKREVGRKAVDTSIRCFALAMLDEGITDDTVVAVYNRAQRYSYWTEENVVRLKEVEELLARYGVKVYTNGDIKCDNILNDILTEV